MTVQITPTTKIETAYDSELGYWTATVHEFDGVCYIPIFEDAEGDTEAEAIQDAKAFITLMELA